MNKAPRILLVDIETAPILGYVWQLWDQTLGVNQIKNDWHLLSWAAKWLGDPPSKMMYMDQRKSKNIEDDKEILVGIWELLDEADVVVTQNGKEFDEKKLNARFVINGMKPPSSFKSVDTRKIAKKKFGFTSTSLEYMSNKLNLKYRKLKHSKFAGFELWAECLKGNHGAWEELEKYNKRDVLALEELYLKLRPWDNSINYAVYEEADIAVCACGSKEFSKNGYAYTSVGKYQRFCCKKCGAESRSRANELPKEVKKNLRVKT